MGIAYSALVAGLSLAGVNMALRQLAGIRSSFLQAFNLPVSRVSALYFATLVGVWTEVGAIFGNSDWGLVARIALGLAGLLFLYVGPVMIAEKRDVVGAVVRSTYLVRGRYFETLNYAVGLGLLSAAA
jgi:hypothetical protein